jgi:hypothetical protein
LNLILLAEGGAKTLWDPTIKGILVTVCAVGLFCGSAYLLLATNLGARLGFLISWTALFGFLCILTTLWLMTDQPLSTLKGRDAKWVPVQVVTNLKDAKIAVIRDPNNARINVNHQFDKQLAPVQQQVESVLNGTVTAKEITAQLQTKDPAKLNTILDLVATITGDDATVKANMESAIVTPGPGSTLPPLRPVPGFSSPFTQATDELSLPSATRFYAGDKHDLNPLRLQFEHSPLYATSEFCTTATLPNIFPNPPQSPVCAPGTTKIMIFTRDLGSTKLRPFGAWCMAIIGFLLGLFLLSQREKNEKARLAAATKASEPTPARVPVNA